MSWENFGGEECQWTNVENVENEKPWQQDEKPWQQDEKPWQQNEKPWQPHYNKQNNYHVGRGFNRGNRGHHRGRFRGRNRGFRGFRGGVNSNRHTYRHFQSEDNEQENKLPNSSNKPPADDERAMQRHNKKFRNRERSRSDSRSRSKGRSNRSNSKHQSNHYRSRSRSRKRNRSRSPRNRSRRSYSRDRKRSKPRDRRTSGPHNSDVNQRSAKLIEDSVVTNASSPESFNDTLENSACNVDQSRRHENSDLRDTIYNRKHRDFKNKSKYSPSASYRNDFRHKISPKQYSCRRGLNINRNDSFHYYRDKSLSDDQGKQIEGNGDSSQVLDKNIQDMDRKLASSTSENDIAQEISELGHGQVNNEHEQPSADEQYHLCAKKLKLMKDENSNYDSDTHDFQNSHLSLNTTENESFEGKNNLSINDNAKIMTSDQINRSYQTENSNFNSPGKLHVDAKMAEHFKTSVAPAEQMSANHSCSNYQHGPEKEAVDSVPYFTNISHSRRLVNKLNHQRSQKSPLITNSSPCKPSHDQCNTSGDVDLKQSCVYSGVSDTCVTSVNGQPVQNPPTFCSEKINSAVDWFVKNSPTGMKAQNSGENTNLDNNSNIELGENEIRTSGAKPSGQINSTENHGNPYSNMSKSCQPADNNSVKEHLAGQSHKMHSHQMKENNLFTGNKRNVKKHSDQYKRNKFSGYNREKKQSHQMDKELFGLAFVTDDQIEKKDQITEQNMSNISDHNMEKNLSDHNKGKNSTDQSIEKIPQVQCKEKFSSGQSKGKIPLDQRREIIPSEQSKGKIPSEQSKGKIPSEQNTEMNLVNQSKGKSSVAQGKEKSLINQGKGENLVDQTKGKNPSNHSKGKNLLDQKKQKTTSDKGVINSSESNKKHKLLDGKQKDKSSFNVNVLKEVSKDNNVSMSENEMKDVEHDIDTIIQDIAVGQVAFQPDKLTSTPVPRKTSTCRNELTISPVPSIKVSHTTNSKNIKQQTTNVDPTDHMPGSIRTDQGHSKNDHGKMNMKDKVTQKQKSAVSSDHSNKKSVDTKEIEKEIEEGKNIFEKLINKKKSPKKSSESDVKNSEPSQTRKVDSTKSDNKCRKIKHKSSSDKIETKGDKSIGSKMENCTKNDQDTDLQQGSNSTKSAIGINTKDDNHAVKIAGEKTSNEKTSPCNTQKSQPTHSLFGRKIRTGLEDLHLIKTPSKERKSVEELSEGSKKDDDKLMVKSKEEKKAKTSLFQVPADLVQNIKKKISKGSVKRLDTSKPKVFRLGSNVKLDEPNSTGKSKENEKTDSRNTGTCDMDKMKNNKSSEAGSKSMTKTETLNEGINKESESSENTGQRTKNKKDKQMQEKTSGGHVKNMVDQFSSKLLTKKEHKSKKKDHSQQKDIPYPKAKDDGISENKKQVQGKEEEQQKTIEKKKKNKSNSSQHSDKKKEPHKSVLKESSKCSDRNGKQRKDSSGKERSSTITADNGDSTGKAKSSTVVGDLVDSPCTVRSSTPKKQLVDNASLQNSVPTGDIGKRNDKNITNEPSISDVDMDMDFNSEVTVMGSNDSETADDEKLNKVSTNQESYRKHDQDDLDKIHHNDVQEVLVDNKNCSQDCKEKESVEKPCQKISCPEEEESFECMATIENVDLSFDELKELDNIGNVELEMTDGQLNGSTDADSVVDKTDSDNVNDFGSADEIDENELLADIETNEIDISQEVTIETSIGESTLEDTEASTVQTEVPDNQEEIHTSDDLMLDPDYMLQEAEECVASLVQDVCTDVDRNQSPNESAKESTSLNPGTDEARLGNDRTDQGTSQCREKLSTHEGTSQFTEKGTSNSTEKETSHCAEQETSPCMEAQKYPSENEGTNPSTEKVNSECSDKQTSQTTRQCADDEKQSIIRMEKGIIKETSAIENQRKNSIQWNLRQSKKDLHTVQSKMSTWYNRHKTSPWISPDKIVTNKQVTGEKIRQPGDEQKTEAVKATEEPESETISPNVPTAEFSENLTESQLKQNKTSEVCTREQSANTGKKEDAQRDVNLTNKGTSHNKETGTETNRDDCLDTAHNIDGVGTELKIVSICGNVDIDMISENVQTSGDNNQVARDNQADVTSVRPATPSLDNLDIIMNSSPMKSIGKAATNVDSSQSKVPSEENNKYLLQVVKMPSLGMKMENLNSALMESEVNMSASESDMDSSAEKLVIDMETEDGLDEKEEMTPVSTTSQETKDTNSLQASVEYSDNCPQKRHDRIHHANASKTINDYDTEINNEGKTANITNTEKDVSDDVSCGGKYIVSKTITSNVNADKRISKNVKANVSDIVTKNDTVSDINVSADKTVSDNVYPRKNHEDNVNAEVKFTSKDSGNGSDDIIAKETNIEDVIADDTVQSNVSGEQTFIYANSTIENNSSKETIDYSTLPQNQLDLSSEFINQSNRLTQFNSEDSRVDNRNDELSDDDDIQIMMYYKGIPQSPWSYVKEEPDNQEGDDEDDFKQPPVLPDLPEYLMPANLLYQHSNTSGNSIVASSQPDSPILEDTLHNLFFNELSKEVHVKYEATPINDDIKEPSPDTHVKYEATPIGKDNDTDDKDDHEKPTKGSPKAEALKFDRDPEKLAAFKKRIKKVVGITINNQNELQSTTEDVSFGDVNVDKIVPPTSEQPNIESEIAKEDKPRSSSCQDNREQEHRYFSEDKPRSPGCQDNREPCIDVESGKEQPSSEHELIKQNPVLGNLLFPKVLQQKNAVMTSSEVSLSTHQHGFEHCRFDQPQSNTCKDSQQQSNQRQPNLQNHSNQASQPLQSKELQPCQQLQPTQLQANLQPNQVQPNQPLNQDQEQNSTTPRSSVSEHTTKLFKCMLLFSMKLTNNGSYDFSRFNNIFFSHAKVMTDGTVCSTVGEFIPSFLTDRLLRCVNCTKCNESFSPYCFMKHVCQVSAKLVSDKSLLNSPKPLDVLEGSARVLWKLLMYVLQMEKYLRIRLNLLSKLRASNPSQQSVPCPNTAGNSLPQQHWDDILSQRNTQPPMAPMTSNYPVNNYQNMTGQYFPKQVPRMPNQQEKLHQPYQGSHVYQQYPAPTQQTTARYGMYNNNLPSAARNQNMAQPTAVRNQNMAQPTAARNQNMAQNMYSNGQRVCNSQGVPLPTYQQSFNPSYRYHNTAVNQGKQTCSGQYQGHMMGSSRSNVGNAGQTVTTSGIAYQQNIPTSRITHDQRSVPSSTYTQPPNCETNMPYSNGYQHRPYQNSQLSNSELNLPAFNVHHPPSQPSNATVNTPYSNGNQNRPATQSPNSEVDISHSNKHHSGLNTATQSPNSEVDISHSNRHHSGPNTVSKSQNSESNLPHSHGHQNGPNTSSHSSNCEASTPHSNGTQYSPHSASQSPSCEEQRPHSNGPSTALQSLNCVVNELNSNQHLSGSDSVLQPTNSEVNTPQSSAHLKRCQSASNEESSKRRKLSEDELSAVRRRLSDTSVPKSYIDIPLGDEDINRNVKKCVETAMQTCNAEENLCVLTSVPAAGSLQINSPQDVLKYFRVAQEIQLQALNSMSVLLENDREKFDKLQRDIEVEKEKRSQAEQRLLEIEKQVDSMQRLVHKD